jgi:glycosyltransferase involved in cell wall biosynthesis
MLLTPGTGYFYCGSCLRDSVLARTLRKLGHDVVVVPLYLPPVLEEPEDGEAVHMGGINMYLQQKTRLARHLPRWLADLLDRPKLLRWASRRGNLTQAADLGSMTVSMLQGECGRQADEVEKLVQWAASTERPDVVVLSNIMLCGIVRRLKQELDRPVVATLQGEAPFLDALPEPFSTQAWQELTERASDIDAFVPVSRSYGDLMAGRLRIEPERIRVIHNGLDLADMLSEPEPLAGREPKTIGFLARMCRDKGLHTLVEAFILLKESGRFEDLRLRIAGAMLSEDRAFVKGLQARLRSRGWQGHSEFLPNIDRAEKLAFLAELSVLSVPATYGESFGLYLLEAMASGVPVVQPRHGAFPEILEATGGGILCEPDDADALAQALEELLLDESKSRELARQGRRSVMEHYTAERMAKEFEELVVKITGRGVGETPQNHSRGTR